MPWGERMNRDATKILHTVVWAVFSVVIALDVPVLSECADVTDERAGFSCTSLMATSEDLVLLGDCEDAGAGHPLAGDPTAAYVFFLPGDPSSGELGRMHTGWLWQSKYRSFQAGMNEAGLAYSLTAVPELPMNPHPERPYVHGRDSFYDSILRRASTVDEAIARTLQFDFSTVWFQIMYADAAGDAAILSPGLDGEMAIARQSEDSSVLVAATFNTAAPEQFIGRDSFVRHRDGQEALTELIDADELSIATFSGIVEQVSRSRPYAFNGSYTMYATTYDLTSRIAYVYVLCNYTAPIIIDLREELQKTHEDRRVGVVEFVSSSKLDRDVQRYWTIQIAGAAVVLLGLAAAAWSALQLFR